MPFMDGPTMIRILQKMNANIRLLVVSGSRQVFDKGISGGVKYLAKPHTAEGLMQASHNVLHQEHP
jgi:CheY-like chemotaxis protein